MPLPPPILPLDELQRRLKDNYLRCEKNLYRVMRNLPKLSIVNGFINIAIVKKELQRQDETEKLRNDLTNPNRSKIYSRYADIFNTQEKELIKLNDLFNPREDKSLKRLIIFGRAGIGKSTLTQKLVYEFARGNLWQEKFDFIFKIKLRNLTKAKYKNSETTLSCIIAKECFNNLSISKEDFEEITRTVATILKERAEKTLIILDGLDELNQQSSPCVSAINELINDTESCEINLLVTSRPFVKNLNPGSFNLELECMGFSTEEIKKYITLKEIGLDERAQQDILVYLEKNSAVYNIVHVPLMLDIFCAIWDKYLPKAKENMTLTEFFQIMMKKLWETYDRRQEEIHYKIKEKELRKNKEKAEKFLEKLAFRALQSGEIMLNASLVCETIQEIYNCNSNYVKQYTQPLLESGFLCSPDYAEDTYDRCNYYFPHLTFQEYFTATHFYHELGLEEKKETQFKSALEQLAKTDLNKKLMISELAVVEFLAEMIKNSAENQRRLLDIVKASKNNPEVAIAAANAITVLNYAGVSFAHMDLQDLNIPGTDLSYSLCYDTIFQGSNLSGVNFQGADLTLANLQGCQMNQVKFGEYPRYQIKDGFNQIHKFSLDLQRLLVGYEDGQVKIFNLTDNQLKIILSCLPSKEKSRIYQLCWDANEQIILSRHDDKKAYLIDQQSKLILPIIVDNHREITSLALNVHNQEKLILVGCEDGFIQLVQYENGVLIKRGALEVLSHNRVTNLAINNDYHIVVGCMDDDAEIYHFIPLENSWHPMPDFKKHTEYLYDFEFIEDGKTFIATGDYSINVYDINTGERIKIFTANSFNSFLCYDYPFIAGGDHNGDIFLWHFNSSEPLIQLGVSDTSISALQMSIKKNIIAFVDSFGTISFHQFNQENIQKKMLSVEYCKGMQSIGLSPNVNYMASVASSHLCLQNTSSWQILKTIEINNLWIECCAVNNQADIIVVGGHYVSSHSENFCGIASIFVNEKNYWLRSPDIIWSVLITQDERYILYGDKGGIITVWNVKEEKIVWSSPLKGEIIALAYCHEKYFIVVSEVHYAIATVTLFKITNGEKLESYAMNIRISPCLSSQLGDYLVAGGHDGYLYLWSRQLALKEPFKFKIYEKEPILDIAVNEKMTLIVGISPSSIFVCQRNGQNISLKCKIIHSDRPNQVFLFETTACLKIISRSQTGSVRHWQASHEDPFKFKLINENGHHRLSLKKTNIEGVQGLSLENLQLVKQRGALGSPSSGIEKKPIDSNLQKNAFKTSPRFFANTDKLSSVKLREGLKDEARLTKILQPYLPAGLVLGKAHAQGDCFFDALAQCLNRMNSTDINTDKYLRMLCHDYYGKNKALVDKLNLKDYGGTDKHDEYSMVQYTIEECEKHFHGRSPIWGRPNIEGIILCNQLNLRGLCVIEILEHPETKQPIPSFHWVNKETYTTISEQEAKEKMSNPEIPTLVVEQNSLHFVPLLAKTSASLDLAVKSLGY